MYGIKTVLHTNVKTSSQMMHSDVGVGHTLYNKLMQKNRSFQIVHILSLNTN